jgi:histidine triad (HIT) family protein
MKCSICQGIQDELPTIVWKDEHWLLRHSTETNIEGYLILEPLRHLLDFSQATPEELSGYGKAVGMAMRAIHAVVKPDRIYTFSLGESAPHLHVHLIPRAPDFPRTYKARGVMQYPLVPGVNAAVMPEICEKMRKELKKQAALLG